MTNKYYQIKTGTQRMRETTFGWTFLVQWSDGTRQWIDLKVLKESNPVKVGEYVIAHGIQDEPAFAWWVPYTVRKRDVIVAGIKSRLKKTSHKYRIEMPMHAPSTEEAVRNAKELDRRNGNTFWMDALSKEMGALVVAFEMLEPG